jgi:DUF2934 family protein
MAEKTEVSRELVARRAYELYIERGSEHGSDVEDWLKAEEELREDGSVESDQVRSKAASAD